MKVKSSVLLSVYCLLPFVLFGQNVGIGTATPNASAQLEVSSTTKGILIPRNTTSGIASIVNPAKGLLILDTVLNKLMINIGTPSSPNWQTVVYSSGWNLAGNSGTNPSTNFIGTTDEQTLTFKVNNLKAGYIDYDPLKANTGFGYQSLFSTTTGYSNAVYGYKSMYSNTSGAYNTAFGAYALSANTGGNDNVVVGYGSLYQNTLGNTNSAFGRDAVYSNTTGYSNTGVGAFVLFKNTDRNNLVAVGDSALFNNGTGTVNSFDATSNTAIGSKAMYANTTGYYNTALGFRAMYNNITGFYNSAIGYGALSGNTSGYNNTAVGLSSLNANTNGYNNTAIGARAMESNQIGYGNTANGFQALNSNNNGYYNSAVGLQTLYTNSSGNNNTANGYSALYYNTTGNSNVAMGSNALFGNSTGYSNIAIGTGALFTSIDKYHNVGVGDSALFNNGYLSFLQYEAIGNTAIGSKALYHNTTGANNSAVGLVALYSNTSGIGNTAIGETALSSNTIGDCNTASGQLSLWLNTSGSRNTAYGFRTLEENYTGSFNTAIGNGADIAGDQSNSTALGSLAHVTTSNTCVIGNSTVTLIGGIVGWSTISDGRFKKNVETNVPGLSFITQLKPVTYTMDIKSLNQFCGNDERKKQNDTSKLKNNDLILELNKINENAIKQKESIVYSGLIAQDVEKAADKIGYNFSGIHKPQNEHDNYSLDYSSFVLPLIKAVQEQQLIIEKQQQQINELLKEIQIIKEKVK